MLLTLWYYEKDIKRRWEFVPKLNYCDYKEDKHFFSFSVKLNDVDCYEGAPAGANRFTKHFLQFCVLNITSDSHYWLFYEYTALLCAKPLIQKRWVIQIFPSFSFNKTCQKEFLKCEETPLYLNSLLHIELIKILRSPEVKTDQQLKSRFHTEAALFGHNCRWVEEVTTDDTRTNLRPDIPARQEDTQ